MPAADLILQNAKVYTVDKGNPWADEVAVRKGKIIHVGQAGSARNLHGAGTKVVDLKGRMVLPGLGDVHNHHMRGGQLDLFERGNRFGRIERAFDQTVHDVCQNDQPVLIAVDRAGLVGEDGATLKALSGVTGKLTISGGAAFKAADKLRGSLSASQYKDVILGLVFGALWVAALRYGRQVDLAKARRAASSSGANPVE